MQVPSNRPLRFLHLKFHATLHTKYEYGLHSTYEHLQTTKLFKKSLFKIPYHQYYCIKKSSSRHQIHFPPAATTEVLCSWIQLIELLDFLRFLPTFYRVQFDQYLPIRQFSWALLSLFLLDDVKGSNLFPLIWKPFQGKNLCSKVVKGFETITPCNVQRPTKM